MAQPTSDLAYAQQTAVFVERRASADLEQTLERVATHLERAAAVLRRMAEQRSVPAPERVSWAQHEIATLLRQLDVADDHLGGVALVWSDARAEVDELDTLLEY